MIFWQEYVPTPIGGDVNGHSHYGKLKVELPCAALSHFSRA